MKDSVELPLRMNNSVSAFQDGAEPQRYGSMAGRSVAREKARSRA